MFQNEVEDILGSNFFAHMNVFWAANIRIIEVNEVITIDLVLSPE